MTAAVASGELRADRALKPLITMLDATKDPDEALPLIRALGRIGKVDSSPEQLRAALQQRGLAAVRTSVVRAVGDEPAHRQLRETVAVEVTGK